jgi:leucyl aminopeptidase
MSFRALPVTVRCDAAQSVATDLLAVFVFEGEPGEPAWLDPVAGSEWRRARDAGELTGKPFEHLLVPGGALAARRLLFIGAGSRETVDGDMVRRVAAAAAMIARQRRAPRLALLLNGLPQLASDGERSAAHIVQAAAEGLTIGQLETAVLKTGALDGAPLSELTLIFPAPSDALGAAAERGRVLGECTNQARLLGNEPANVLTPRVFAERVRELIDGTALQVDVLEEDRLAALGMGLLLGVARGSAEPPRLVALRHEPPGVTSGPVLGFVGKGITFDTGGISI